ncbi:MAG: hypothetical protein MI920_35920, partial [Kiloniellales bacterium]|nr:hypothetical protein [Kiloniellales bacterium]
GDGGDGEGLAARVTNLETSMQQLQKDQEVTKSLLGDIAKDTSGVRAGIQGLSETADRLGENTSGMRAELRELTSSMDKLGTAVLSHVEAATGTNERIDTLNEAMSEYRTEFKSGVGGVRREVEGVREEVGSLRDQTDKRFERLGDEVNIGFKKVEVGLAGVNGKLEKTPSNWQLVTIVGGFLAVAVVLSKVL